MICGYSSFFAEEGQDDPVDDDDDIEDDESIYYADSRDETKMTSIFGIGH